METFFTRNPNELNSSQEIITRAKEMPEALEFVPKFAHIQEDLLYLFNIQVTSETSLQYPWVKDEMYAKAVEELKLGTPFALDYFFEEKLLTRNELRERGFYELKPYALTILKTFKGTRLTRAKDLFIDTGLLSEEETKNSV
jgi:hypothetical protein